MNTRQANEYSLLQALGDFFDTLPATLAAAEQRELLKDAAGLFPPLLRLGLECRLNGHPQVDLQLCMRRDEDDLQRLLQWVRAEFADADSEQEKITAFFQKWAYDSSPYHKNITEIFLELDVLPSGNRVPLLFFALEPNLSAVEIKAFCLPVLKETLGSDRSFFKLFEIIADARPEGAFVAYIGMLFSRDIDVLRVNIKKMTISAVVPFLIKIGYQWITPELEQWITFVFSYTDRVTLCLDIGKDVYPKIGFECFWNEQPPRETYWSHFLNELQDQNLCLAEKLAAVLTWDSEILPGQITGWPQHLWIQSLTKPDNEFTILKKKLSHLKLAYTPGKQAELKAYLGYGNLWHKVNIPAEKDVIEADDEKKVAVSGVAVAEAINRGIDFLLNSQQQSGWWKDFYLPAGKSDEWVTAYIACHLARLKNYKTDEALNRAWDILQTRYRPNKGWGYNALTPADADSTSWTCLLALALGFEDRLPVDMNDLMGQYFTAEGGITTYSEKEPIRAKTGLSADSSFGGWQMLHLCVTAAYALTGNEKALDYLYQHQHTDGYWDSYWWTMPEYATSLAVEAMQQNGADKYEKAILKAKTWACNQAAHALDDNNANGFKMSLLLNILLTGDNDNEQEKLNSRIAEYLLNAQQEQGCWDGTAELRVPMPANTDPDNKTDSWVVKDMNKNFTTATVLGALNQFVQYKN